MSSFNLDSYLALYLTLVSCGDVSTRSCFQVLARLISCSLSSSTSRSFATPALSLPFSSCKWRTFCPLRTGIWTLYEGSYSSKHPFVPRLHGYPIILNWIYTSYLVGDSHQWSSYAVVLSIYSCCCVGIGRIFIKQNRTTTLFRFSANSQSSTRITILTCRYNVIRKYSCKTCKKVCR